ncbi:MAG: hypothetical protein AAF485_04345, partial [Chloroflexota bacterium]
SKTLINDQLVGSGWHPINPGDTLVVGSVRFYLTTTRPAKVAAPHQTPPATKRTAIPITAATVPPTEAKTDSPASPPPSEAPPSTNKRQIPSGWLILAALLLLIIGGAGGAYLFSSTSSEQPLTPTENSVALEEQPSVTPTATVPEPTATPTPQPTTVPTNTTQPTATPTESQTAQTASEADTLVSPTPSTEASPTSTETTASETATPTSTSLPSKTPTATATATEAIAVVVTLSGPTVIPIDSEESIDEIGFQEVIDIDINPKNPREVYALVKREGIYKSSNGGDEPWVKLPVDASSVTTFVIDPTNPTRLYAPTWNAVLKSTDGGNSWDALTNGLVANRAVDTLVVDPIDPDILYVGVGENIASSTNGGQSWSSQTVGRGLAVGKLHTITVDPFNHNTIYVAGLASAIYKSTNSGESFTPLPYNVGQGAFAFTPHPTQKDSFLVGMNSGDAAIAQTQNGVEFTSVSQGLLFGGGDSAYSAIVYAPSRPTIVYTGSGYEDDRLAKGIFKSSDGGESWRGINDGLSINPATGQPYYVKAIAVSPDDPDIVFAATGNGLYKSVNGGVTWQLR